jgi:hypothetical protein
MSACETAADPITDRQTRAAAANFSDFMMLFLKAGNWALQGFEAGSIPTTSDVAKRFP